MRSYEVITVKTPADIERAERLNVDEYRWLEAYAPKVTAAVVLVEGQGFLIRMDCREKEPRAVFTEPDSTVCCDSCMECFMDFAPGSGRGYMNLEANANGALHTKIGPGRKNRTPLRSMNVPMPSVKAERGEEGWSLCFFVPLDCVKALYGKRDFKAGDIIRANFYKCGDETDTPHYGMWNGVETPTPDFHRPEFFGELVIRGGE